MLIWLAVGSAAGWIAGQVVKGIGIGLIGNIVVDILGSVVGTLFPWLDLVIAPGIIDAIIHAFFGAIILLFVLPLIRRA